MVLIEKSIIERLEGKVDALSAKLDTLIQALAVEQEETPTRTLDGDLDGGERDPDAAL
jgi:hypothetical protein